MEKDNRPGYLESEHDIPSGDLRFDRREFLKITGSGIFIFFTAGKLEASMQRQRGREYPADLNAYLKIGEDGRVTCYSGKIEMGQGIITSLAQMLAEEMDVALDSVAMVMGDTDTCPYDGGTFGSRSTKYFGPALRQAAAQARAVLLQLASEKLNISPDRLYVQDGIVKDLSSTHSISYASLAQGQRIERSLPDTPIKEYRKHTISGKPIPRSDAREKVTGRAKFAGDIQLPDMLYARIKRPPSHRAVLKNADTSKASQLKDVIIVHEGQMIAALHKNPEIADRALADISVSWERAADHTNNSNIFEHIQNIPSYGEIVTENGDIAQGEKDSTKLHSSTFYNHFVAHAPIEPHTVVAEVRKDKTRIWASTQTPFRMREAVAEALKVPPGQVQIMTPFLGGGFGGKKIGQYIMEAVKLSKITSRPVQVALDRKEEFFYDTFRPAAVIKMRTGIDDEGRIRLWEYDNFYAGSRSSEPVYAIPHFKVQSRQSKDENQPIHPFEVGAWRGPGSNTNVFAMESQTDIMAAAAGMDPLSFRLHNLDDHRMIRVLKEAAARFSHAFSAAPSGKGYGIACTNYLNTYVATMAEVEVDKHSGMVRVIRIVCAQDMGEIINPLGAELQIEGGLTMGLSYALREEIQFEDGQILTENFDSYEITRFSWAPVVETILIDNPDLPPQGCGEPAITTTGAVIANAIFDACGARIYTLPITPERILNALREK